MVFLPRIENTELRKAGHTVRTTFINENDKWIFWVASVREEGG